MTAYRWTALHDADIEYGLDFAITGDIEADTADEAVLRTRAENGFEHRMWDVWVVETPQTDTP